MASNKGESGSKSAFIRDHADLVPGEVEAAAKAAGLEITAAYVSTIRSADKIKGAKSPKRGKAKSGNTTKAASARKASSAARVTRGASRAPRESGRQTNGGMSKSDFIRSQPASLAANDVVAAAKAAGFTITPGLVYTVRGASKAKSGAPSRATSTTSARTRGAARETVSAKPSKSAAAPAPSGRIGDHVKEILRVAIAAAGIDGAAHLIEQARKRIDMIA